MVTSDGQPTYVLGLDIGTHSVGWAVIALDDGQPAGLERVGVRIFEPGVEEVQYEQGRADPPGQKRRQARSARRLTARRARRMEKLLHILQDAGLLPQGDPDDIFPSLDAEVLDRYRAEAASDDDSGPLPQVLHYWLRARALDEKLSARELGRALYQLAQRRGYQTNRRVPGGDDEGGQVAEGISELREKMEAAGARTLGEYFAGLNPHQSRIRDRWTSRQMYEEEFEAIWNAQQPHHPGVLPDELKEQVHEAIFYQRPLKRQSYLIGTCTLEGDRKRAPWGLLDAQRYRILQKVNDTRVTSPDGVERALTEKERATLYEALQRKEKLTFAQARRTLRLTPKHALNWESGGEKNLPGNSTNARLLKVFGDRWWGMSRADREQVVEDLLSFEKRDALARRGRRHWGLDKQTAEEFADIQLQPGYCRLSRKALKNLLPYMLGGMPYQEAVKQCYPDHFEPSAALDSLPPLSETDLDVTNPVVRRALTELRKVANGVVRRYGKPDRVRIELARDLRRGARGREQSWRRSRRNQAARKDAAEKLAAEMGMQNPTRADIEKVLLAQECNWECPYTGRSFGMHDLLGPSPQFEVEHIIPFSRSLDNSYLNKTICEVHENRTRKGNRTPWEAYGETDRWEAIVERVKCFQGSAADLKLRRFQEREPASLDEVAQRELQDTRYASRLAMQYVGLLFGGYWDEEGSRRIQAVRGGTTAYLRDMWNLNALLGDGDLKTRDDHRHHAVDAVTIALTSPGSVKAISKKADEVRRSGRVSFDDVVPPWPGFLPEVSDAIHDVNVSHRPDRRVNGPLHEETFYAPGPETDQDRRPEYFHQRKPVDDLTPSKVEDIVDPTIRDAVQQKLEEVGGTPRQAFKDPENHPSWTAGDGREVPVHNVTIRVNVSAVPIGEGDARRWVKPGSNHHMEVIETEDGRWEGRLVSRLEAMERLRQGEPIVKRGPDFVFSLAPGDMIELDQENGERGLYVVRSVWQEKNGSCRVRYVDASDARRLTDIGAPKLVINSLGRLNCKKVTVTPFGQVRYAND
ncbi:MAG: type II CRISPR RNA-guided endonuclease Cas9 [Planctomycetota bacterium]